MVYHCPEFPNSVKSEFPHTSRNYSNHSYQSMFWYLLITHIAHTCINNTKYRIAKTPSTFKCQYLFIYVIVLTPVALISQ
jgi:hypothetical protein